MSDFLDELESFPGLEGSTIRKTKIHKVLKAMIKLPSIPLDEKFRFKIRSHDLLQKWNDTLTIDPIAKLEEAAAPEEDSEEKLERKIGTTTEGEKEADRDEDLKSDEPAQDAPVGAATTASNPAEEYQPPAEEIGDEPTV